MINRPLRNWSRAIFFLLVVVSISGRPAHADMLPLNAEQMVKLSPDIVVAVVEREQARWNDQHTLIVTDYFLRIESRLRGKAPDRVTLTMPGGTLDGETHDTSLSVHLKKGERYLLFCADLRHPQMSPITGADQGAFREVRGADGTRQVAPAAPGAPSLEADGKKIRFEDFVAAVRELVSKSNLDSAVILPGWSEKAGRLPAKAYVRFAAGPDGRATRPPALSGAFLQLSPAAAPKDAGTPETLSLGAAYGRTSDLEKLAEEYVYQSRPPAPVVFNQLPPNLTPWSPEDQGMMGYWNVYATNLFRVYVTPTGTWSWGNGVNDIAGFPSDADMVSQFGASGAWSPGVLAVTYSRTNGGPIIEADIAVNPHFQWTTDDALATTSSPAQSFRQTILHELGHSWGLKHPWETQQVWWDSVMNYSPKNFRLTRLLSDDTAAVRSAYPGTSIHDGLLSAYVTGYGSDNNAVYSPCTPIPTVVAAGSSFHLSNSLTIENVGTNDLVNPVLEIYLTPRRLSFEGAVYIKTIQYTGAIHVFPNSSIQRLDVGTVTLPASVPSGLYSIGFFLRDDADGLQGNNSAWTDTFIQVQGNSALSCTPGTTTLCIDDQSGDRRFKVEVAFSTTAGGGHSGNGVAVPLSSLGVNRGGLFWFFSADNPEMLVKVLNGCGYNGAFWFFTSAGTNIGLTVTVTDTVIGRQKVYTNADGVNAAPILDTSAFSCSPR